MEMTLARALRYQKRVKEQIAKVEADISAYNSVSEGAVREIEGTIGDCLKKRDSLVDHLLRLKLAIMRATSPIQPYILRLSEVKGKISFLNRISTTHGLVMDRYSNGTGTTYSAEIRKSERDRMIVELQAEIDELQGRIDAHNANTKITVAEI